MTIQFSSIQYITAIFLASLLSACGGSPTIDDINSSSTTIKDYAVVGSDAADSTGQIPINSGVNGGAFKVTWDVDSSDPYRAELYLSTDSTLDRSNDINIFGTNCGSISLLYYCGAQADFDCRFTNENKMSCHTVNSANLERDLTGFLDTIPKSAYLILYACDLSFQCKESAVAVTMF